MKLYHQIRNKFCKKNFAFTLKNCLLAFITYSVFTVNLSFAQNNLHFTKFSEVYDSRFAQGAILNECFHGFKEDYLLLHCLITKYQPKTFFEIGTCTGEGTMIIKNAIGAGVVYSLELPPHILQETEYYGLVGRIGINCHMQYIQLYGDSMIYNYSQHFPIEGWFIDGCHDYQHVLHESKQAILSGASLIVWHDTDIPQVFQGVKDAFLGNQDYQLFRVADTRITYAIKM